MLSYTILEEKTSTKVKNKPCKFKLQDLFLNFFVFCANMQTNEIIHKIMHHSA